jgi:hypothetical protein
MKKQTTSKQPRTNSKKKKITVLGLIANESTSDARKLLHKYGIEDAVNHADLEVKLSQMYAKADDKKKLEKELAEIHPHRELILEYLAPKPEEIIAPVEAIKEIAKEEIKPETKSNCSGCSAFSNCSGGSGSSNACGCSNATGSTSSNKVPEQIVSRNNDVILLATLGLIGIFALVVSKR